MNGPLSGPFCFSGLAGPGRRRTRGAEVFYGVVGVDGEVVEPPADATGPAVAVGHAVVDQCHVVTRATDVVAVAARAVSTGANARDLLEAGRQSGHVQRFGGAQHDEPFVSRGHAEDM